MNRIFFCMPQHTLTADQIAGLEAEFGITTDNIILIQDVNPELAKAAAQVPADWDLEDVQELAARIVLEAVKSGATHFCAQGEPCLSFWNNLLASGNASYFSTSRPRTYFVAADQYSGIELAGYKRAPKFICVQSTTVRNSTETTDEKGVVVKVSGAFKHVKWRKIC